LRRRASTPSRYLVANRAGERILGGQIAPRPHRYHGMPRSGCPICAGLHRCFRTRLTGRTVVDILNKLFRCQVFGDQGALRRSPEVHRVDGLLAVFPGSIVCLRCPQVCSARAELRSTPPPARSGCRYSARRHCPSASASGLRCMSEKILYEQHSAAATVSTFTASVPPSSRGAAGKNRGPFSILHDRWRSAVDVRRKYAAGGWTELVEFFRSPDFQRRRCRFAAGMRACIVTATRLSVGCVVRRCGAWFNV